MGLDIGLKRLTAARAASATDPAETGRVRSPVELSRDEFVEDFAWTFVDRDGGTGKGLNSPRSLCLFPSFGWPLKMPCKRKDGLRARSRSFDGGGEDPTSVASD